MSGGQVFDDRDAVLPANVVYAEVSANAKLLYAVFTLFADREGGCYPGRKKIAAIMRCSDDTVSRAKAELSEAKLIECHERYDEHGRRTTDNVFLRGALRKDAEYVLRKDAEAEVYPEGRTPLTKSVGGSDRVDPRKSDPPPPDPAERLADIEAARLAREAELVALPPEESEAMKAKIRTWREGVGI